MISTHYVITDKYISLLMSAVRNDMTSIAKHLDIIHLNYILKPIIKSDYMVNVHLQFTIIDLS